METIFEKKCLLDTNVLLFLWDSNSPYHQRAKQLADAIEKQRFACYISVQSLLEFSAVLTRAYKKPSKAVASEVSLLISDANIHVVYPTQIVMPIFLQLFEKNPNVYVFDLYLAATALSMDIEYIISDDHDFSHIPGIRLFNPFGKVTSDE